MAITMATHKKPIAINKPVEIASFFIVNFSLFILGFKNKVEYTIFHWNMPTPLKFPLISKMYCIAMATIIKKVAIDGITLIIVDRSPMNDHFFKY
ncbi:hypothetical protein D3C76_1637170 [compost metagenome]